MAADPWAGFDTKTTTKAPAKPAAKTKAPAKDPWAGFNGQATSSSRTQTYSGEVQKGTSPPPKKDKGFGGFLKRAGKGLENTVVNAPRGLVHITAALPGEIARSAGADTSHGTANMFKTLLIGQDAKKVPKGQEAHGTAEKVATVLRGGVSPREAANALPGESTSEAMRRTNPIIAGFADSAGRTANRLSHPQALARDYWADPVGSLVEDAANLSIVLGPVAKGLDTVAEGSRASSLAGRAAEGANKIAALPFKPYELAVQGGGKLFGRAAASEGALGDVIRLTRMDPESRALRRETLQPGQEAISEATGQQVKLGQRVDKLVHDPVEQQAMYVIGEHQGPALAAVRAHLGEEGLAKFVDDTFHGSVSHEAAHLAADVAEGKAPELAARIDQALQVGREGAGGRAERAAAYVDRPSREAQLGFEPLPGKVEAATEPFQRALTKQRATLQLAQDRATAARARAGEVSDTAAGRAEQRGVATADRALATARSRFERAIARQEDRAVTAADRATSQRDLAEAAKTPRPLNLDRVTTRAEGLAQRGVAQTERAGRLFDTGAASTLAAREAAARTGERFGSAIESAAQQGVAPGRAIGRAAERSAQADRLARMESRRVNLLRDKLGRLPEEATAKPITTFGEGASVGGAEARAAQAERVANLAGRRVTSLEDRIGKITRLTEQDVASAPARLRPVLEVNRRAANALIGHVNDLRAQGLHDSANLVEHSIEDLPRTLKALQDAGVDPEHFIHVQAGDKATSAGVAGGSLPKVRKARSERFRSDSLHFDRSVRAQVQGEIDEARTVIAREAAEKVAQMPFATKLGQGPLEGLHSAEEAKAAGYVPWNPSALFEKPSRMRKASDIDLALGTGPQTTFIPEHIFDGFKSYFSDPKYEKLLRKLYDQPIQAWKVSVLALNPSWNVGNVMGNMVLATLGAGVNPIDLGRHIIEAVKQYRASGPRGEREFAPPRRLLTAGPTHQEFSFLRAPSDELLGGTKAGAVVKAGSAPLRAVARGGYAMNEFIDNVGRSAVYLAKKEKGLSDEAAVKESLKAMGDFSRMTPFERRVVRRVIPFYAWQRHITQLAFRLPFEHPLRVAWTMNLANLYGQPDFGLDNLPAYLRGAIDLPGGKSLLETSRFFPFGDAGRVLDPKGIVSSLSPAIKLGVANTLGVNLSKGGKPFTRPSGTGRFDEFGNPLPTAPSILKQLEDLVPQKRVLDALTGRDKVVRYDTGDPIIQGRSTKSVGHPMPSGRSTSQGVLRYLGIPIDNRDEAIQTAQRIKDKQDQTARQRANRGKPIPKKVSTKAKTAKDPWAGF